MFRFYLRCVLFGSIVLLVRSEPTCPAVQHGCTCEFDANAEDGGEPVVAETTSKSEILAATAGAMTPLLIGGAGFGIYKFMKGRGDDSLGMDRPDSSMSGDMDDSNTNRGPPPYEKRRGSNALSMTDHDDKYSRRGSNNVSF